jgi:catechol 2,3-dioxygenase-like lactoylglutathione lyase family enzyme
LTAIGDFLELSVATDDIRESADFWTRFGLVPAVTGDTWSHRYAVFTDGSLFLGIHEYAFESPAFTFVRPGLAARLPSLVDAGLEFVFAKTSDDEFNEAGFRDPDGHMVALLEARTFSEPHEPPPPLAGPFIHFALTTPDVQGSLDFWAGLGFAASEADGRGDVAGHGLAIALEAGARGRPPVLVFAADPVAAVRERVITAGLPAGPLRALGPGAEGFELVSPEGLRLRVTGATA